MMEGGGSWNGLGSRQVGRRNPSVLTLHMVVVFARWTDSSLSLAGPWKPMGDLQWLHAAGDCCAELEDLAGQGSEVQALQPEGIA